MNRTGPPAASESESNAGTERQSDAGGFQSGTQPGKRPVVVWVKTGEKIHRTRIVTGAIDPMNAEIKSGLKEGDEVILSMNLARKGKQLPNLQLNEVLSCLREEGDIMRR